LSTNDLTTARTMIANAINNMGVPDHREEFENLAKALMALNDEHHRRMRAGEA